MYSCVIPSSCILAAQRRAPRTGPLAGKAGEFARLLPLTFVTLYLNDTEVGDNARAKRRRKGQRAHHMRLLSPRSVRSPITLV